MISAYLAFWDLHEELESHGVKVDDNLADFLAVAAEEIGDLADLVDGMRDERQAD